MVCTGTDGLDGPNFNCMIIFQSRKSRSREDASDVTNKFTDKLKESMRANSECRDSRARQ